MKTRETVNFKQAKFKSKSSSMGDIVFKLTPIK